MAYTRTWPEVNFLLGTRDADEIDDASRETHLDLTERFSDILYDVNATPWKIKVPGVSPEGTYTYRIPVVPWTLILGDVQRNNFDVQPIPSGGSFIPCGLGFPLVIPANTTILNYEIVGFRTAVGASVQVSLAELDYNTSSFTSLAVVVLPIVQPGIQFHGSPDLNVVAALNKSYYFSVSLHPDTAATPETSRLSSVGIGLKLAGAP
jgi:hypothetical protein